MKPLLIAIGLLISIDSYSQKYVVGLVKTGGTIKNLDGQIIVADSTVTSIFDGQTTTLKILSRKGYTIHVMNGEYEGKYVIGHSAGKLHGFTYDRHIHYHEKHHTKAPTSVFYCQIKRD